MKMQRRDVVSSDTSQDGVSGADDCVYKHGPTPNNPIGNMGVVRQQLNEMASRPLTEVDKYLLRGFYVTHTKLDTAIAKHDKKGIMRNFVGMSPNLQKMLDDYERGNHAGCGYQKLSTEKKDIPKRPRVEDIIPTDQN